MGKTIVEALVFLLRREAQRATFSDDAVKAMNLADRLEGHLAEEASAGASEKKAKEG